MPESTMVGRTSGRFGVAQLVAIEATAMAVAAAAYALTPVSGLVAVGAVLLVLLGVLGVLGRVRRRWTYGTLGARSRLARRRRGAQRAAPRTEELVVRGARAADPRLTAVAPGLTVTTVPDRRGAFGVGQDQLGWFAAVSVHPADALSRAHSVHMRPSRLAALAADPALPASSLQLVVRHVPLPAATIHPDTACAVSYRELQQAAQQVRVHREIWVATRLSPRAAAAAAADRGGGLTGVHRSLAAALNRLTTGLGEAELGHRTLDGGELLQALASASDLDPAGPGADPGAVEHWSHLRTARATQVSFAVGRWPAHTPSDALAWLAAVPAALSVTTAMVFRRKSTPGRAGIRVLVRVLIRVVAAPAAIDECVDQLHTNAASLRLHLVRLDGEQAAGVYSTAPTGATVGLVPW